MKFSAVFLAPVLAWTAAAAVLPAQEDVQARDAMDTRDVATAGLDSHLAVRAATDMQKDLITANQKGVPKFKLPTKPTKGKKVPLPKRDSGSALAGDAPNLERRKDKEADLNKVARGTSSDTVFTRGLGPCTGIIVTFSGITKGKINKISAHIGAYGGSRALSRMTDEVYSAAVEGGVWNDYLDPGHQPEIHVSYPDVTAEVQLMINNGDLKEKDRKSMENTLRSVNDGIKATLSGLQTQLGGRIHPDDRRGAKRTGSSMHCTKNNIVSVDGRPF